MGSVMQLAAEIKVSYLERYIKFTAVLHKQLVSVSLLESYDNFTYYLQC